MQSIISTLLVILSRFNGNSHTSNIIIECFIPPTKSVMPKPFSSMNVSHVSSPLPKVLREWWSAQQDNVFSTHYLLYWFNLLEASWPWIHIVAVALAVWQHPQLHTGIVGCRKKPKPTVCCSWLWKQPYTTSLYTTDEKNLRTAVNCAVL